MQAAVECKVSTHRDSLANQLLRGHPREHARGPWLRRRLLLSSEEISQTQALAVLTRLWALRFQRPDKQASGSHWKSWSRRRLPGVTLAERALQVPLPTAGGSRGARRHCRDTVSGQMGPVAPSQSSRDRVPAALCRRAQEAAARPLGPHGGAHEAAVTSSVSGTALESPGPLCLHAA